jgi:Cytochrome P450
MDEGIAHRALSDVEVNGFVIPKDAIVLFNIYGTHMDEQLWKPNPNEFRPERFLNDQGDLVNHENFIPFGNFYDEVTIEPTFSEFHCFRSGKAEMYRGESGKVESLPVFRVIFAFLRHQGGREYPRLRRKRWHHSVPKAVQSQARQETQHV